MAIDRRQLKYGFLFALVGINVLIFTLVLLRPSHILTVSFLDVGQGDAILIESPTGTDVLIDGGRDRSVVRELPKRLGPFDRTIDLVVATHPDADHIGALPSVLDRYQVSYVLEPGVSSDTSPTKAFAASVLEEKGVTTMLARRGMRINLGGGAHMDVLFPDRNVSGLETNTGSVIARLVYGETSFLLTGDAPSSIENWLTLLDGEELKSNILKAGHHGSRTSTSEAWLSAVDPSVVVISAGKDNSYGHPHAEVLENIQASGASMEATLGEGTVTFVSDGKSVRRK